MVYALGNPLKVILISGQNNDITQAEALVEDIVNTMLLADIGYVSNALIEQLQTQICIAVIPSKKIVPTRKIMISMYIKSVI